MWVVWRRWIGLKSPWLSQILIGSLLYPVISQICFIFLSTLAHNSTSNLESHQRLRSQFIHQAEVGKVLEKLHQSSGTGFSIQWAPILLVSYWARRRMMSRKNSLIPLLKENCVYQLEFQLKRITEVPESLFCHYRWFNVPDINGTSSFNKDTFLDNDDT